MTRSREWIRPELVALVRSQPEERVLITCKGGDTEGANNNVAGCFVQYETPPARCFGDGCSMQVTS